MVHYINMRKKIFIAIAVTFLILLGLYFYGKPRPAAIQYGVTFSVPDAQSLGLNRKQAYADTLTDLNVKLLRIPVYWDEVETSQNKYDFSDIDYMINLASAKPRPGSFGHWQTPSALAGVPRAGLGGKII